MTKPLSSLIERRLAGRVPAPSQKLFTFCLERKWFALPLESTLKVLQADQIREDSLARSFIDFEGEPVLIVDCRHRLIGESQRLPRSALCAIVVQNSRGRFALALDTQPALRRVKLSEYRPLKISPESCLSAYIPAQSESEPPLLVIDCERLLDT